MTDKSLKSKAIKVSGKDYVLVADRVIYFNDTYPEGFILTELISDPESDLVVVKATVFPDHKNTTRAFTGYSQAIKGDGPVNKTAALENCETSAVGRALAMMGIGVIDSIASVDEINKATASTGQRAKFTSPKQIEWLRGEARRVIGDDHDDNIDKWIEENVGVKPDKLAGKDTVKAVEKIRQIGSELKEQERIANKVIDKVEMSEEDEAKLDNGTLLDSVDY